MYYFRVSAFKHGPEHFTGIGIFQAKKFLNNNYFAHIRMIVKLPGWMFPYHHAGCSHGTYAIELKLIRYTKKKPGYRYDPDLHTLFSDFSGCAFSYDISLL